MGQYGEAKTMLASIQGSRWFRKISQVTLIMTHFGVLCYGMKPT